MEIFLSSNCKSFTGSLGRGFGYSIQRRKNRFFAKRNSRGTVPRDGHWKFIVACAVLAKAGLHISDIKVHCFELLSALYKAKHSIAYELVNRNYTYKHKDYYNASDIINLKITFGL